MKPLILCVLLAAAVMLPAAELEPEQLPADWAGQEPGGLSPTERKGAGEKRREEADSGNRRDGRSHLSRSRLRLFSKYI